MAKNPTQVYRVNLENDTYVYLCVRHLRQWREDGGTETAHVAKGLTPAGDCDYCRAAKVKTDKPWTY